VHIILERCQYDGAPGQERFGNHWVDTLATGMVHAMDFRFELTSEMERAFRRVVLHEEGAQP